MDDLSSFDSQASYAAVSPNERFEPRSRTSRLFFLMALRFTNLVRSVAVALIEIGIRLGDSIAYMISVGLQLLRILVETLLEFFIVAIDALRILVIVVSRYVYAKTDEARTILEARAKLDDSKRLRVGGRSEQPRPGPARASPLEERPSAFGMD